ncbi:Clr5 domain-containing protein [Podospora aff. communis PSN243]|uniref:Clr5 domain-containing protein n=1 Tax=Podospora aff. communis PSN243 TaxID=3040156 RepID=A0AAV9G6P1_9PEZI|nr:Clr5 domain-containing protein [Podospora aff. communis PSN243]
MVETRRSGPSVEDWDNHRDTIESLYLHQDKTLKDVSRIMRQTYGFTATPRQYIHRFTKWGLRKYIPNHAMRAMVAVRNERRRQGQPEPEFTWNGHRVDASRLDRFSRLECFSDDGELDPHGRCAIRYLYAIQ